MPLKIIRNDITRMNTDAIVNTANARPTVGAGCDRAVYKAAGHTRLLNYRKENVGTVSEGEAFITPGFTLRAKYIIHAVSPRYKDGNSGEEEKLRSCYRESLRLAKENDVKTIAIPLISTGSFGYPKEEGIRIAVDEINSFLLSNDMMIYLVVFDSKSTDLGRRLNPKLETYIDHNYVREAREQEYGDLRSERPRACISSKTIVYPRRVDGGTREKGALPNMGMQAHNPPMAQYSVMPANLWENEDAVNRLNERLNERIAHKADTFSEYLLYLIESKGMKNSEVYNRAIIDKRYFSKIKNNKDFHPEKIKALCLCVGAKLNIDETKDLLARAGYALSPSDLTDIIFSFFIENEHYDVVDIDIFLEEHNLPCIIS